MVINAPIANVRVVTSDVEIDGEGKGCIYFKDSSRLAWFQL